MLLKIRKVFTYQFGSKSFALATHFQLDEKTLTYVSGATTDRIQASNNLACFFYKLFGPSTHCRNLFVRGIQSTICVEIANNGYGCFTNVLFDRTHVELPFEMLGE